MDLIRWPDAPNSPALAPQEPTDLHDDQGTGGWRPSSGHS
jgi:hypothetical protein